MNADGREYDARTWLCFVFLVGPGRAWVRFAPRRPCYLICLNVLIIGGTGFIGPHIARRLIARGHDVTVLHRGNMETSDLPESVRHIHTDIAALPDDHDIRADAVIHVYALTQEDAETAVRLFRGRTRKLVVLSSGDVYRAYGVLQGTEAGGLDPTPITEESRLRTTLYPYRESMPDYEKILVERTLMSAQDPPACVLRLPVVYGPGDRHHRFQRWVKRMDQDSPEILLGARMAGWRWTHGYVENVADAIGIAAVDSRTAGRVYNIGEATVPTMQERLQRLAEIMGWKGRIQVLPDEELPPESRIAFNFRQDMDVATGRFRAETSFVDPVDEDEGLRRTVGWERA
jgi:nucleoside-diphosphate-sugar epimerase